jgi:predicted MFS family arabinose efflux permease
VDSTRPAVRERIAVAATFSAHAVVAGTVGPWIPSLKARSGLDAGALGLALGAYAGGLVAGTRLAGPVVRRTGRGAVRTGIPLLAAALALLPLAGRLAWLAGIFALLGLVSGLLDVAMNLEAAAVEARARRRVMSGMHGAWSASMLVGAAIASAGVAARVPIEVHLAVVAILLAAGSWPLLRWLPPAGNEHPGRRPAADRGPPSPATSSVRSSPRSTGTVVLLCLIPFAAFLTEGVAAEWSAVYLRSSAGTTPGVAGVGIVAFSAGMAASRFPGDRLAARIEPSTVVGTGTAVAAAALGTALIAGGVAAALTAFTLVGLGVGPAVPLAFSEAARMRRPRSGSVLGLAVTAGYLGSIAGPMAVGFTADRFGLRTALVIPVAMCLAAALGAGAIRPRPAAR